MNISFLIPVILLIGALVVAAVTVAVVLLGRRKGNPAQVTSCAPSMPSEGEKTVYCTKCGAKILESDKFCVSCGAPQA